jgi:hypothetical protein
MDKFLILLDIDEVILLNNHSSHPVWNKRLMEKFENKKNAMYSQTVVEKIVQWHNSGSAEICWLTMWSTAAQVTFAPTVGLPHFKLAFNPWETASSTGRPNKAKIFLRLYRQNKENKRKIIWIDNELTYYLEKYKNKLTTNDFPELEEVVNDPFVLLVQPNSDLGLVPSDIELIDNFLNNVITGKEVVEHNLVILRVGRYDFFERVLVFLNSGKAAMVNIFGHCEVLLDAKQQLLKMFEAAETLAAEGKSCQDRLERKVLRYRLSSDTAKCNSALTSLFLMMEQRKDIPAVDINSEKVLLLLNPTCVYFYWESGFTFSHPYWQEEEMKEGLIGGRCRWSVKVLDKLIGWHLSGKVEFRWNRFMSKMFTVAIAKALGIPEIVPLSPFYKLPKEEKDIFPAVCDSLCGKRKIVWIDTVNQSETVTADLLTINCEERIGILPDHLALIDTFIEAARSESN